MNIREVPLDDLILDPSLNLRDRLDDFTVERYADSWDRLPPITVFEVEGRLLIADGFHRHASAVMMGKRTIPAEVREGTITDALDFVAGVNLFHGLPLTRAERRRAVEIKLKLHPDWSDRRLAQELAVSRDLVFKIRDQLVKAHQIPSLPGRVGADGKVYTTAGLPKDENERLPRDNAQAGADDEPAERSRRSMTVSSPPWEDDKIQAPEKVGKASPPSGPPPFDQEARAAALAVATPTAPDEATIDEMLEVMARQINEVLTWTRADGFAEAYRSAGGNARGLFQSAVLSLSRRAGELRQS